MLFFMCDDLGAWPRAVIFGLEDHMLPYQEADLDGIASNSKRTVELQWKVMVKELPRNGQHLEFQQHETVPLQHVSVIKNFGKDVKGVDKIRWLNDQDDRVYVRKWFTVNRQPQKAAILHQINAMRKLDHPNISKILCSYAKGSGISFIAPLGEQNLDEFLRNSPDVGKHRFLLDWVNDLTQAVAYLHSLEMSHRSIRPQKILIQDNRLILSAFGIGVENESRCSADSSEHQYLAPETLSRRKFGRQADVFSLGRVFLDLLCVARGHSLSGLENFLKASPLSSPSHASDPTMANLAAHNSRLAAWIKQEFAAAATEASGSAPSNQRQRAALEKYALAFTSEMLAAEPNRRPKMRMLAVQVAKRWNEAKTLQRRRSFDATADTGGRWPELTSLEGYYSGR